MIPSSVVGFEIGKQICAALGIDPSAAHKVVITIEPTEPVRFDVEFVAREKTLEALQEVFRSESFRLVRDGEK